MKRLYVSLLLGFLLMPVLASAGAVITYHGRILDIHDVPVEASSVVFKISIFQLGMVLVREPQQIQDLPWKRLFQITQMQTLTVH